MSEFEPRVEIEEIKGTPMAKVIYHTTENEAVEFYLPKELTSLLSREPAAVKEVLSRESESTQ